MVLCIRLFRVFFLISGLLLLGTTSSPLLAQEGSAGDELLVRGFEYEPAPVEPEKCQGSVIPENCDAAVRAAKVFSLQVPIDWHAKTEHGGYALFIEPIEKKIPTDLHPIVANPNITVAVTTNPMPIDETSLNYFLEEIKTGFKTASGENSTFEIIQKTVYEGLPGGRKGLLYYLSYEANGIPYGQAVLVLSSDKARFRVTLTDLQTFLDSNLERYFPVMASIEISGGVFPRETMFGVMFPYAASALGLLALIWLALWFRMRRVKKLMEEFTIDGPNYKLDYDAEPSSNSDRESPADSVGSEEAAYPPFEEDD